LLKEMVCIVLTPDPDDLALKSGDGRMRDDL
jgi:hypothetical protein